MEGYPEAVATLATLRGCIFPQDSRLADLFATNGRSCARLLTLNLSKRAAEQYDGRCEQVRLLSPISRAIPAGVRKSVCDRIPGR